MFIEIYRSPVLSLGDETLDSVMLLGSRRLRLTAGLCLLIALSGCNYYADRMSVGQQQFRQGKYPQAEKAFSEATKAAEDGERLYDSLKALAAVYEARGYIEMAEAANLHAVMVMGHCLEDRMNGLRPCPVRETDLQISFQPGG